MDKQVAIQFLVAHQPMPSDKEMSKETIGTYDEARRYFIANPDARCIDLFLHSFGEGSGYGIYQVVDEVLRQYPPIEIVPRLAVCLKSELRSTRYWCAEMAAAFPDPALVIPLRDLLQEDDFDMRSAAVTALFTIVDERVDGILSAALRLETDAELREQIRDALQFRRDRRL